MFKDRSRSPRRRQRSPSPRSRQGDDGGRRCDGKIEFNRQRHSLDYDRRNADRPRQHEDTSHNRMRDDDKGDMDRARKSEGKTTALVIRVNDRLSYDGMKELRLLQPMAYKSPSPSTSHAEFARKTDEF